MLGRSKPGYPPLSPLGGGATSWVVRDFLEASSRGRFQVWRLEGDIDAEEVFEEDNVYETFEADDEAEDEFEELVKHLDNQWW
jgi:hypothetical protein